MEEIFFPSVPNLVNIDSYSNRLKMLIQTRVIYPYDFIGMKKEFKSLYSEAIHSFLYGCPDAALSLAVRCLERGLKEYLSKKGIGEISYRNGKNTDKRVKLEYARLFDLINCSENPVKDKEILQYLKSLRNYTHEDTLVEDFHALEAIKHVTDALNQLFQFKNITVTVERCRLCGQKHSITVDAGEYYLGNRIMLKCPNHSLGIGSGVLGEFIVNLN